MPFKGAPILGLRNLLDFAKHLEDYYDDYDTHTLPTTTTPPD